MKKIYINIFPKIKNIFNKIVDRKVASFFNLFLILIVVFSLYQIVFAVTPNPGHAWTEVGDGTFAVTGPTVLRTYTYPDANATVLTTNAAVTVAQGGTGLTALTQGDILYSSAANTLSALAKNTSASRYLSNTGSSNNPAWAQIDLTNGVTGILPATNGGTANGFTAFTGPATATKTFTLPNVSSTILTTNDLVTLAQGGTNANLTASNGGIVYSTAGAMAILAGTATSNQILMSGATSAPSWSTATYPATAGTSGNFMKSDGTNWVSTTPFSITTILSKPLGLSTGALTSVAINSLTTRRAGLINIPTRITVNQLSYNVAAVTTAGTSKICVYSEDGNTKLIDVTSGTNALGTRNVTVSPAVTLDPGNYYVVTGCATTCNITVSHFTTTALTMLTTPPAGKKRYEGTTTHTSGTCNATLPAITGAVTSTPVIRFDN